MRYEVAIQAFDRPLPEQVKAGDVVDVRPAKGTMGRKQLADFLWITVDMTPEQAAGLTESVLNADGTIRFKRRWMIPLVKLKSIASSFSEARAKDPKDEYQPFVDVTLNRAKQRVRADLPFNDLFFDKLEGVTRRG